MPVGTVGSDPLELKLHQQGDVHIAQLSGEFAVGEESRIASELQPLVAIANSKLAIDLAELDGINSMGLSELINVVIRARLSHSRVVLVAPSSFVKGVFEVTRLDRWFDAFATMDEAIETLND